MGSYKIRLQFGINNVLTEREATLKVIAQRPVLSSVTDADSNGIFDNNEPDDENGNAIPDSQERPSADN